MKKLTSLLPARISVHFSRNFRNLYVKKRNFLRRKKIIWHFCTPKSASTFLTVCLINIWTGKAKKRKIVPFWGGRAQEPCVHQMFDAVSLHEDKIFYTGQTHTKNSNYIRSILSDKHHPIIQTRNIFDTVVSIKDHLEKEPHTPFFISQSESWSTLSEEEKYFWIIYNYVPWHIDFVKSWENYEKKLWVSYDEVVNNTEDVLVEISRFTSIDVSRSFINEALEQILYGRKRDHIRFNKGISGRGKRTLNEEYKSIIHQISDALNFEL